MDILSMLSEMSSGQVLSHVNSKFRELNESVKGTLGKGKMVIEVSVAPGKTAFGGDLETVVIGVEVKLKKPELALGESIFFIDDEAELSRNDPRQEALFAERKEVKANG